MEDASTLHDIDSLHEVERQVSALLEERVAPAVIEVIHLDHDCTQVCSALDPGNPPHQHITLPGMMPPPHMEAP